MDRVSFFIDGFNVYHALISGNKYRKYLWLDYRKFANRFVRKCDTTADVYYFSALPDWHTDKLHRHYAFIDALKSVEVQIILGQFKRKERYCKQCGNYVWSREEKRTDVNIAITLLKDAVLDKYDTGVLVTNDTDLIPAIDSVKQLYPQKRIGVVFPINRWSHELKEACHFWRKSSAKDYKKSQFPWSVELPKHETVIRPGTFY